ncbi:MAG: methyltransferase domain-containing protein [Candidatus Daviesbacteria bacterium]|nr:methyltransferase domain-containing protein [Candidatus Daviesbacteria bacterium]
MDLTLFISFGVLIGCAIGLSWFAGSDAPFVPTKMENIRKILKLANVGRGRKFYELGSGDGRVVIEAAKLEADAVGIEQSLIRVIYSRYTASRLKLKNAKFYHGNIFSKDYTDADVIYIYLLNKGVGRLEEKLKKELKKGSVVITQTYHFPNWKPYQSQGDFWLYRQ